MTTRKEEIEHKALMRMVRAIERIADSMERLEFTLTGVDKLPEEAYDRLRECLRESE